MHCRRGARNISPERVWRKGLRLVSELCVSFLVLGSTSSMVRSEMIRTGFSGIMLMELFKELFCVGEVGGSSPLIFFISTFITHPAYIVEQLASRPALEVIFRVQNFADFVFNIAVDFNRFGRWRLSIRESVWNRRLDLRDMEDRVNELEFMRESETNGVLANAVNDLKGPRNGSASLQVGWVVFIFFEIMKTLSLGWMSGGGMRQLSESTW